MIALQMGNLEQQVLEGFLQRSGYNGSEGLTGEGGCMIAAYDEDRLVGVGGIIGAGAAGMPSFQFVIDPEYQDRELKRNMEKLLVFPKRKAPVSTRSLG